MEKAFDHVNWDFIFYISRRTRFGPKWRKCISACISMARFSILFNGSSMASSIALRVFAKGTLYLRFSLF
jgi:hypothetical protein